MYYDKRIRYLSYYESDIKLQNAGYVKFQVRDSLCQMIIYVKGPRLMGSGEAAVYLLSERQDRREMDSFYSGGGKNKMQQHLLGNLSIRNGQGHCAVRLNAEDMTGDGLRYDEVCGIRIELQEYQYLESRWAVVNFMPERRQMQENAGAERKMGQMQRKEESAVNGGGRSGHRGENGVEEPVEVSLIVTPVSENVRVEKIAESGAEVNIPEEETAGTKTAKESLPDEDSSREMSMSPAVETETITAEMFRDEDGKKSMEEELHVEIVPEEARAEMPVAETEDFVSEAFREEESMQEMLEKEIRKEEAKRGGEPEYTLEEEILHGVEEAQNQEEEIRLAEQELQPDKWEQLRKTYPIVHPIREEEEYLKISPKDFVIFTEKYQELVHNSFLLHGYYNYKHLILGKKEKGGKVVYYLGVPGTFHEREKTVAVMFGFEAFDGKREPAETGDFGYYLRRVEI